MTYYSRKTSRIKLLAATVAFMVFTSAIQPDVTLAFFSESNNEQNSTIPEGNQVSGESAVSNQQALMDNSFSTEVVLTTGSFGSHSISVVEDAGSHSIKVINGDTGSPITSISIASDGIDGNPYSITTESNDDGSTSTIINAKSEDGKTLKFIHYSADSNGNTKEPICIKEETITSDFFNTDVLKESIAKVVGRGSRKKWREKQVNFIDPSTGNIVQSNFYTDGNQPLRTVLYATDSNGDMFERVVIEHSGGDHSLLKIYDANNPGTEVSMAQVYDPQYIYDNTGLITSIDADTTSRAYEHIDFHFDIDLQAPTGNGGIGISNLGRGIVTNVDIPDIAALPPEQKGFDDGLTGIYDESISVLGGVSQDAYNEGFRQGLGQAYANGDISLPWNASGFNTPDFNDNNDNGIFDRGDDWQVEYWAEFYIDDSVMPTEVFNASLRLENPDTGEIVFQNQNCNTDCTSTFSAETIPGGTYDIIININGIDHVLDEVDMPHLPPIDRGFDDGLTGIYDESISVLGGVSQDAYNEGFRQGLGQAYANGDISLPWNASGFNTPDFNDNNDNGIFDRGDDWQVEYWAEFYIDDTVMPLEIFNASLRLEDPDTGAIVFQNQNCNTDCTSTFSAETIPGGTYDIIININGIDHVLDEVDIPSILPEAHYYTSGFGQGSLVIREQDNLEAPYIAILTNQSGDIREYPLMAEPIIIDGSNSTTITAELVNPHPSTLGKNSDYRGSSTITFYRDHSNKSNDYIHEKGSKYVPTCGACGYEERLEPKGDRWNFVPVYIRIGGDPNGYHPSPTYSAYTLRYSDSGMLTERMIYQQNSHFVLNMTSDAITDNATFEIVDKTNNITYQGYMESIVFRYGNITIPENSQIFYDFSGTNSSITSTLGDELRGSLKVSMWNRKVEII